MNPLKAYLKNCAKNKDLGCTSTTTVNHYSAIFCNSPSCEGVQIYVSRFYITYLTWSSDAEDTKIMLDIYRFAMNNVTNDHLAWSL